MIIKKKTAKENQEKGTQSVSNGGGKIIKGGLKKLKQNTKKEAETIPETKEEKKPAPPPKKPLDLKLEEYEKIELTSLEFKERYERRRGERRRGFRRIDERTLVSRAQEEAQNIREIAAKEGYKNGLMEAQSEIEALKTALADFISTKKDIYEEMSSNILEIALEVAKKIIKKETELSNDVLKTVMKEVFDELNSTDEKVTVKVNPQEVDFARASIPDILKETGLDVKISVTGDELVEKGSCTVIANNGVVDANFSTQLSIIQQAFGIYKGGE